MNWREALVAPDGTHHVVGGRPMYGQRFLSVQKFHPPGLAPVRDTSGAHHILPTGLPAYEPRFLATWGFYEGLAAARADDGWTHVRPDGSTLSSLRFAWCGNFQGGRCAVREASGEYLHLGTTGAPAYRERYRYVGDFREGRAVVLCGRRNLCTHVDGDGRLVHGRWFIDLDVFHKGFARARDSDGWFHVDARGVAAYPERYAAVEPFYNGTALAQTRHGARILIGPDGREQLAIGSIQPNSGPRAG